MNTFRIRKYVAFLLLFVMLVSVFPIRSFALVSDVTDDQHELEAEIFTPETTEAPSDLETTEPQVPEEESEASTEAKDFEPADTESSGTEPSTETGVPADTHSQVEEPPAPDNTEQDVERLMPISEASRDHLLCRIVGDRFVPYDPDNDDLNADNPMDARPDSTIKYSDIFSAHSADMNGNKIKAGGAYSGISYGNSWWPSSTANVSKELSFDGIHYVCIGAMYANQGPYSVSWESGDWCGLAIRPSQEDGYASTSNSAYYARGSGVPNYKLELLKTKQIPQYSEAEWTVINLICAVANGMSPLKVSTGSATHIAAAYTLVMNVVLGYIGLGSDYLFHGLPIATSSAAVNKEMCEILVRCEVYTKEKQLGGTATGDNTLNRLKTKLNYTPTDMTDYSVQNGTATYQDMRYLQINKSTSSGNQIYIWGVNSIEFESGKPVTLKKTIQASNSALGCIEGNPLYSLAGAEYSIYKSYVSSGSLQETLVTDENGNATSSKRYPVGTVLYAVEAKAPPGFLKTSGATMLTVSADNNENVFSVTDVPTFDPEALELTKTGTHSKKIQGAVFKAEFFAATSPTGAAKRTWYFQSDVNGRIRFDESHFADNYSSDALFKPDGVISFPIGCIKITEIKAAQGYVLPYGNSGTAYIYIKQSQPGKAATATWGDAAGNAVSTIGMYTITNDAVTAVNTEGGTMSMQKASSNGNVEGYCFRLYRYKDEAAGVSSKTWRGKSDAEGNVYITDSDFNEPETKVYVFEDLLDGTYAFRELLSLYGTGNVWPEYITFITSGGTTPSCEMTFSGDALQEDTNGDCTISSIALTGLNGGGHLTVVIHNKPIAAPGGITVHKVDERNQPLSGVTFLLEYSQDDGTTWSPVFFQEEAAGIIAGGCTSPGLEDGLLITGADGIVAFFGLQGSTDQAAIRYRLTEVATLPGNSLLTGPVFEGELSPDDALDLEFTVVNSPNYQLPFTGGNGFVLSTIGIGMALCAAALAAGLSRRKKEEA